jgi:hypothetical protein
MNKHSMVSIVKMLQQREELFYVGSLIIDIDKTGSKWHTVLHNTNTQRQDYDENFRNLL